MRKRIRGFSNYTVDENGIVMNAVSGKIIKHNVGLGGYPAVVINGDDGRQHHLFVHRIVADEFVDNPYGFKYVNHKDENINNCAASNLEWCTSSYNNTYNGRAIKAGRKVAETIKARGGPHNKGKHISNEQKRKISKAMKGKPFHGNQYVDSNKNKIW